MTIRLLAVALLLPIWLQNPNQTAPAEQARIDAQNAALRELVKNAKALPMAQGALPIVAPAQAGWAKTTSTS